MNDAPTVADLFRATVERIPERPALGRIEGGALRWWTWAEVGLEVRARSQRGSFSGELDALDDLALQVLGRPRLTATTTSGDGLPPEVATVVETSGTNGAPRGVMLSWQNLATNAIALSEASGGDGSELRLSFLPMSHLYARTCDLYAWVVRGSRLVLAESPKTVFRDCKLARPTVVNGVPYFFQKGIDLADAQGASLKELLGGAIRRCYCGGAPLARAVEDRFAAEGVPIHCGYGLTEASPVVSANTMLAHKPGTVGRPLPGVEIRIATDGEVLVRGPNVMLGYRDDPAATAEALRDGWLHTGDLGALDDEGFLSITGRKKELLVLSTGKNVAPSRVEAMLCVSPWIEQAAVFGEGRSGLVALLVPNPDRVRAEVRRQRLWVWSRRGALGHAAIRDVFRREVDAALASVAREERVHDFCVVDRAFSRERGEVTSKNSLRRDVIARNFGPLLGSLTG
ncbi:MAG: AMP-dependent synthetase/ligase [Lacipirellulaceae bacterium]